MIVMYAKTIRGRNVMTLYFYEDRLNIISMNAANGAKNDVLSSCGRGTIVPVSTCRTWHRKWLYSKHISFVCYRFVSIILMYVMPAKQN